MSVREIRVSGLEALLVASELLQRVRRADPTAGMWEAADVQWWWRKPRPSDEVEQSFWIDDQGPVAGVWLTSQGDDAWQCDPILVPEGMGPSQETIWARAVEQVTEHVVGRVQVPLRGGDQAFRHLVEASGLVPGQSDNAAWMSAGDRPEVRACPAGFVLVDRGQPGAAPHPMRHRNGDGVEERLRQCPLYDPRLDLAVETVDGRVAGYSLYWFDPVNAVGLVEPVRVEDDFQRRGLARVMLTAGIDRLSDLGATRVKIGYGSAAAGALYLGLGFRRTSQDVWYEGPAEALGSSPSM